MSEPHGEDQKTAPGSARALRYAFILLVLGYHIAMPLTYYLSDRVYDERFSWRMFSTVRLQDCSITLTEAVERDGRLTETPVPVAQDLQTAWIGVLQRLRPSVIEKYLTRRCDEAGAQKVSFVGRCMGTDGRLQPASRYVMACGDYSLARETEP